MRSDTLWGKPIKGRVDFGKKKKFQLKFCSVVLFLRKTINVVMLILNRSSTNFSFNVLFTAILIS